MTKRTYILFMFIFGFLNIPKDASACGSDSEKDCCKKEVSHHSTKKSCENDVKNQKKIR